MSENKKPRLADVLGVEVGEEFEVGAFGSIYHIDKYGILRGVNNIPDSYVAVYAINNPEEIRRAPRWTEREVEDAKNIIRLFGTEDFTCAMKDENGYPGLSDTDDFFTMGTIGLENNIFPSLKPGEFVKLTDIIGGNK